MAVVVGSVSTHSSASTSTSAASASAIPGYFAYCTPLTLFTLHDDDDEMTYARIQIPGSMSTLTLGTLTTFALLVTLTTSLELCTSNANCTGGCACALPLANPKSCFFPQAAMDMGKSCGCDFGPGKVLNKSCVQCTLDQLYNPCTTKRATACDTDADCPTDGCTCATASSNVVFPGSVCMHKTLYATKVVGCKTCNGDPDCPGSKCLPPADTTASAPTRRVCADCEAVHGINAATKCAVTTANKQNETDTNAATKPKAVPTPSDPESKNTVQVPPPALPPAKPAPAPAPEKDARTERESTVAPTATAEPPCVSTEWLRMRRLLHEAIHHAGSAPVLCVPAGELPCGTPGHLLRTTTDKLVSYQEVCEKRRDCVQSTMEVSQLSHAFDWSPFRSDDGTLSLTSLSAHPDAPAGAWTTSRIVAHAADMLNNAGFGFVSNFVALCPHRVRDVSSSLMRMVMAVARTG